MLKRTKQRMKEKSGILGINFDMQLSNFSSLAFMKDILPSYFSSEWSFAQFHVPDAHSLVCFGENSSIIGTLILSFN